MRRIPQQQIADRDRQGRQIEQGMAAAPARVQIVRELADDRIEHRIQAQRREQDVGHARRRQVHDLVVEQQKDGLESVVLDAEGDGSEAVEQLGAQASHVALQRGGLVDLGVHA